MKKLANIRLVLNAIHSKFNTVVVLSWHIDVLWFLTSNMYNVNDPGCWLVLPRNKSVNISCINWVSHYFILSDFYQKDLMEKLQRTYIFVCPIYDVHKTD